MILSPSGRTTSTTNSQTSSISIMTLFKPVNQQSLTDLSPFFFVNNIENIMEMILNTPPGVKLLLKPKTKILNGFYILNDQTCEVLGGTVNKLVHKWKLNKLMGKHVRTLIGEGAPLPWVPFGTKHTSAKTVDTSKRSMDVAKMQQANEEDPEFVRQRRAAIDTLLTDRISKTQRFSKQNVINGTNLEKGFEQANQRMANERAKTASTTFVSSSVSNKPNNMAATTEVIKANSRLPEWAKNQIADEAIENDKRRAPSDRKQFSKNNFSDDNRSKRGGGDFGGRNRRGRGRDDDDGGEETRPSKDVTLFDFI
ncbi:unnamed protein product [Rotaria sordida]|uniref:RecQ mediated genome instability protein 1 OB-fold domain-containing protein n=1 Tax=Rotaria sordida TaxID=392033 RepID=A0A814YIA6_9BILA|nr:unnamed protein product [Rotaria sordida]